MLRLWGIVALKYDNKNPFKYTIKTFIRKLSSALKITANRIAQNVNKLGQKKTNAKGKMLFADSNLTKPLLVKEDWIDTMTVHMFEGSLFSVPTGYDKLLLACYGDYMQLPPKEKRVTHHGFNAYMK